ncbi:MAG: hypothetical protein KatS3mg015_1298 [Fimbriimonadales bacterium]|nr:MAG: hypothetical protein KatS3mg015_1298 [Fimbriimonadales bacterium]
MTPKADNQKRTTWVYFALPAPEPKADRRVRALGLEGVSPNADLFRMRARSDGANEAAGIVERIARWYPQADRIGVSLNPPLARMLTAPSAASRLVLDVDELDAAVADVPLGEVPDILPREASRLNLRGVFTAGEFVTLEEQDLRRIMGSARGAWWAKALRGEDVPATAPSYLSRGLILGTPRHGPADVRTAVRKALRTAVAALVGKGLTADEVWVEIAAQPTAIRKRMPVRLLDASAIEQELFRRFSLDEVPCPQRVSVRFLGIRPVEQPTLTFFEADESAA